MNKVSLRQSSIINQVGMRSLFNKVVNSKSYTNFLAHRTLKMLKRPNTPIEEEGGPIISASSCHSL